MKQEPEDVCKCPKCGCEIEMVMVRRGYIKKFKKPLKDGRRYGRVSGVYRYRERKVKEKI